MFFFKSTNIFTLFQQARIFFYENTCLSFLYSTVQIYILHIINHNSDKNELLRTKFLPLYACFKKRIPNFHTGNFAGA